VPNQAALLLKVEPALDRFDRVLLRVDVSLSRQDQEGRRNTEGANEVKIIAYVDGVGEVARASISLNGAQRNGRPALDSSDAGVLLTPVFGLRNSGDGYVPEFYLAGLRAQQIGEGETEVVRPGDPLPLVAAAPAPALAAPAARVVTLPPAPKGARGLVVAVDTSSSMAPVIEKARGAALELLASLQPGDRFALLDCFREVHAYAADWTPATPDNVRRAQEWLRGLQVKSGTNTAGALERALAYAGATQVVLVTDGGPPSTGHTDPAQLAQLARARLAPRGRVDAVFVAPPPDGSLVARLARDTGGAVITR
jgi:hypothetical protein